MHSLRVPTNPSALLIALIACLAIPVIAQDHGNRNNINLNMTFDRGANQMSDADTGGPPFFDNPYNAVGNVSIDDINIPQGTARITGLDVEFDVDLCQDVNCTNIVKTLRYKARFDDTVGQASLKDPKNPNSLFVTGNPTGGWVHHTGGGKPDTTIQFVQFTYSQSPPLFYSVNFTFFSREFQANISVTLSGPPPPK